MDTLTKVQQSIVEEFAAKHQVSLEIALRFLLGRKWDRERADVLLGNYIKLKAEKGLEQQTINDVLDELKTGKLSILGSKAKDGSSLLMINALKHDPGQFTGDSTIRLSFFMAETVTSSVDAQRDGITVICYMEDLKWEQSDYAFYKDVVLLFQDNFPCRVKNIFVFSPPWWISLLIAVVSPMMKPKMRERIHIVTERESLLEWIDRDALPVELDGHCKYDQESFIRRQMAKASTAKITGIMSADPQMEDVDLSDNELAVTEELAEELVGERERAVEELGAAIRKRRASLTTQHAPIDFTKLARSKAARLTVSLADSMPVVTPMAPPIVPPMDAMHIDQVESESEILDVETVPPEEQHEKVPEYAEEQHITLETIPEEENANEKGFMDFSDDNEDDRDKQDTQVDVEKIDDDLKNEDNGDTMQRPKARKRGSKRPRPAALQM